MVCRIRPPVQGSTPLSKNQLPVPICLQLKEGLHTIISQPLGTKFHLTPTGSLAVGSAVGDAAIPRIADQDEAVSML